MRERVVIVGAGVGGLTAAHELIERGFEVDVYERRSYAGGKAASQRLPNCQLPREHGFRFFPGWYKHLPDTLRRIPYRGRRDLYQDASVLNNLVTVDSSLLAWYRRDPISAPLHVPRTAGQAGQVFSFVERMQTLGLGFGEITFFVSKLLEFLALPESERIARVEPLSWWDYVEAESKSDAFSDLMAATTRTMVAAKATEASAYTIARLAVRTLFDAFTAVDRVLNGPTTEVWIDPWVAYLRSRGVNFNFGFDLESLNFQQGQKKLRSVRFTEVKPDDSPRVQRICERIRKAATRLMETFGSDELEQRRKHNWELQLKDDCLALSSLPGDAFTEVLNKLSQPMRHLHVLSSLSPSPPASKPAKFWEVEADYFVFALPVEQMAYFVNRSTMLKHHDPTLERIVELASYTDWMSGIQYYLNVPLDLARGHIVCMESEWGLTAVEQTQFWRDVPGIQEGVKAILSVDVATWDRRGRFLQREAFNCSKQEVAEEVWAQLKAALNRSGQSTPRLRDDMLRGFTNDESGTHSPLKCIGRDGFGNYHLDDSVIDVFDRKKQASFEKARGVQPGRSQGLPPWTSPSDAPYVWGRRMLYNAEPLLICRSGARALRPEAGTQIDNVFLAGDYVLTETDLACMEGANEAARRAVNALLDRSGSREERCELWRFTTTDELVGRMRDLARGAAGMTSALGAAKTLGKVAGGMWDVAGRLAGVKRSNRSKQ